MNWNEGANKLEEMTRTGEVTWIQQSSIRYSDFSRSAIIVGIPYFCEFDGSSFALYEIRFQAYNDDNGLYWRHTAVLELVDDDGRLLKELIAGSGPTLSLLEEVRTKLSGAEGVLNKLLSKGVKKPTK